MTDGQHSAATNAVTVHVEDGERVFPCYCGETHRGQYAAEDWAHHNCLHTSALMLIDAALSDVFMCPDCGRVFETVTAASDGDSSAQE